MQTASCDALDQHKRGSSLSPDTPCNDEDTMQTSVVLQLREEGQTTSRHQGTEKQGEDEEGIIEQGVRKLELQAKTKRLQLRMKLDEVINHVACFQAFEDAKQTFFTNQADRVQACENAKQLKFKNEQARIQACENAKQLKFKNEQARIQACEENEQARIQACENAKQLKFKNEQARIQACENAKQLRLDNKLRARRAEAEMAKLRRSEELAERNHQIQMESKAAAKRKFAAETDVGINELRAKRAKCKTMMKEEDAKQATTTAARNVELRNADAAVTVPKLADLAAKFSGCRLS